MRAAPLLRRATSASVAVLLGMTAGVPSLLAQPRPSASSDTATADMVPFRLSHPPVVSLFVNVRVEGDVVLLPLSQILTELQVEHRLDVRGATLRLGKQSVRLPASGTRLTPLEAYVTPAVFDSLTGLHAEVSINALTIAIVSETELPVTAEAKRVRSRPRTVGLGAEEDSTAPMLHPRDRRLLGANVVEYLASSSGAIGAQGVALELHAGGEVAGGEIELRMRGTRPATGAATFQRSDARWRFVLSGGPVTQVMVGRQSAGGIQPVTFDGIEINNRPAVPRRNAGLHMVEGEARPDWLVEVYVNDRLVGTTRANALGRWRTGVPVGYGASTVRLRFIGPNGEVREEEQLLQVPFGLVPTRTLEYGLAGGRLPQGRGTVLHGRAAYGVTEWLTLRGGADATRAIAPSTDPLDDAIADTTARARLATFTPVAYGGITARMFRIANLAVDVAPSVLTRASFELRARSQASLTLTGTRWGSASGSLNAGARSDYGGQVWMPLRLHGLPVTARLAANTRLLQTDAAQHSGSAELSAQLGAFSPSLQYRVEERVSAAGRQSQREVRAAAQLFAGHMLPGPFRNTFLRAATGADLVTHRLRSMEVYAGRPIGTRAQIDLSWSRDGFARSSRLETRFFWRLGVTRVASAIAHAGGRTAIDQSVGGTLAYDAGARRLIATDRPLIGRAGASVRLYLDANGNGRLDAGERPLQGARVRISGGQQFDRHGARVSDLFAYERYVARVDKASLANPLWIPTHDVVAFVADPSRIKPIDVPLYPGASIEGRVVQAVAAADTGRAVPGLRLQLLRDDGAVSVTLPTFADGTFYHPGLPPGTYTLRVDPTQLERLGMTASPAQRRVTIVPTPDGAQLEGLGFVLKEAAPAETKVP